MTGPRPYTSYRHQPLPHAPLRGTLFPLLWLGRGQAAQAGPHPRLEDLWGRTLVSETGPPGATPSAPFRGAPVGEGRGQRRWASQEAGRSGPRGPHTPSLQQMRSAPIGHRGPQQGSPTGRQRPDVGDKCSRTLSAGAAGQPGEAHKGAGAGLGRGLGCTCHRCPGDGPLRERSAGPLSGAHRTCHPPDGRVLCESVIGRVKECGPVASRGAICSLRLRAPAGTERRPAGPASAAALIS